MELRLSEFLRELWGGSAQRAEWAMTVGRIAVASS